MRLLAPHRGLHRANLGVERRAVGSEGLAPCARLGLALGKRLQDRLALVLHRPKHRRLALGYHFESTGDSVCVRVDRGAHLVRVLGGRAHPQFPRPGVSLRK